ncbi:MAG: hypothetical protein ACI4QZ_08735 [Eubacteriales bacterium]
MEKVSLESSKTFKKVFPRAPCRTQREIFCPPFLKGGEGRGRVASVAHRSERNPRARQAAPRRGRPLSALSFCLAFSLRLQSQRKSGFGFDESFHRFAFSMAF